MSTAYSYSAMVVNKTFRRVCKMFGISMQWNQGLLCPLPSYIVKVYYHLKALCRLDAPLMKYSICVPRESKHQYFPAPASLAAWLPRDQVSFFSKFFVDQTSRKTQAVKLSCSYQLSYFNTWDNTFYCKWQQVSFGFGCLEFGMFSRVVIRQLLTTHHLI